MNAHDTVSLHMLRFTLSGALAVLGTDNTLVHINSQLYRSKAPFHQHGRWVLLAGREVAIPLVQAAADSAAAQHLARLNCVVAQATRRHIEYARCCLSVNSDRYDQSQRALAANELKAARELIDTEIFRDAKIIAALDPTP